MGKKKLTMDKRHNLIGWLFLSVGVILICWTSFYPMIQAFILSMKNGLGVNLKFAGFSNYARILKDPTFKGTLFNTFFYLIIQVPIMLTLALIDLKQQGPEIQRAVAYLYFPAVCDFPCFLFHDLPFTVCK